MKENVEKNAININSDIVLLIALKAKSIYDINKYQERVLENESVIQECSDNRKEYFSRYNRKRAQALRKLERLRKKKDRINKKQDDAIDVLFCEE